MFVGEFCRGLADNQNVQYYRLLGFPVFQEMLFLLVLSVASCQTQGVKHMAQVIDVARSA